MTVKHFVYERERELCMMLNTCRNALIYSLKIEMKIENSWSGFTQCKKLNFLLSTVAIPHQYHAENMLNNINQLYKIYNDETQKH